MKKFISVLLIFTLLFTMSSSIFADNQEPSKVNENIGVVTEVTEAEYIQIILQHSDLSLDEVKNMINERKEEAVKASILAETSFDKSGNVGTLGIASLGYYTAINNVNFAAGTVFYSPVEIGMAYTVYTYGSFRQVQSIDSTWTGATGDGLYEWTQFTLYTYPSTLPSSWCQAKARGAVETHIDVSIGGNLELKNSLVGAGFSVSGQVGTTYYLRKVGDLEVYRSVQ